MRINEIKLQCEDIMWFGVDTVGHIFECTSAGCGNVPEYVCRSQEETEKLLDFFTNKIAKTTSPVLIIPNADNPLTDDAKDLSSKGIYCFDITDFDDIENYHIISRPEKPISVNDLPSDIKEIISDHIFEGDVSISESISVSHAY